MPVTIALLMNHWAVRPMLKTPRKLSSVKFSGENDVVSRTSARLSVSASAAIHIMGMSHTSAATIIATW